MFSLAGRKALITGGSQGLGAGIALALARQGADVAISYLARFDQDAQACENTRADVAALGRTALLIEADMTADADVSRLRDEVLTSFGSLDILVNNVGGFPTKPLPLIEMSNEDWDSSIDLNLKSAFLCCRAFGQVMSEQGSGRLINISASLSAFTGIANCAHYGAAKMGVLTMTKALARELAPRGVTVNAVAPGHVETPMNRLGVAEGWWDEEEELAGISLGRGGTVEDIAAAVCFFAADEAGWITGQTLNVNGGSYMH